VTHHFSSSATSGGGAPGGIFGVDTRKRDAIALGALLDAITPVIEQGAFKAPLFDRAVPLSEGPAAYEQVARGEAKGRLFLVP
jgi:hypothetical protein